MKERTDTGEGEGKGLRKAIKGDIRPLPLADPKHDKGNLRKILDKGSLRTDPTYKDVNFTTNNSTSEKNFYEIRRHVLGPIFKNPFKALGRFDKLRKYMWVAILDDLFDPKIAKSTFISGGHGNTDSRISRTGEYFGDVLVKYQMDEVKELVNFLHETFGISNRDPKTGELSIDPHYIDAFTYVAGSMIERQRDFFEHELGIKRESPKGQDMALDLCDLWYGAAHDLGLNDRPETVKDHDNFIKAHEAKIMHQTLSSDAKQSSESKQKMVRGMTDKMIPVLAKYAGCTPKEMADCVKHIRSPELAKLLDIDREGTPSKDSTEPVIKPEPWSTQKEDQTNPLIRTYDHVRSIIFPQEKDPVLAALRKAGNQTRDRVIQAIYHMADRRSDKITLERKTIHLNPNETLIEPGVPSENLYVVLDILNKNGSLELVRTSDKELMKSDADDEVPETPHKVKVLKILPGNPAVLGEVGMVRGTTIGTVKAGRDGAVVDAVVIPRKQYLELLELNERPWLERNLARKVQGQMKRHEAATAEFKKVKGLIKNKDTGEDKDTELRDIMEKIQGLGDSNASGAQTQLAEDTSKLQDRIIAYIQDEHTPEEHLQVMGRYLASALWDLGLSRKLAGEKGPATARESSRRGPGGGCPAGHG